MIIQVLVVRPCGVSRTHAANDPALLRVEGWRVTASIPQASRCAPALMNRTNEQMVEFASAGVRHCPPLERGCLFALSDSSVSSSSYLLLLCVPADIWPFLQMTLRANGCECHRDLEAHIYE